MAKRKMSKGMSKGAHQLWLEGASWDELHQEAPAEFIKGREAMAGVRQEIVKEGSDPLIRQLEFVLKYEGTELSSCFVGQDEILEQLKNKGMLSDFGETVKAEIERTFFEKIKRELKKRRILIESCNVPIKEKKMTITYCGEGE